MKFSLATFYHRPSTAWLVLAMGMALSIAGAYLVARQTEREARLEFDSAVSEAQAAIETRINDYADVLRGARGLFSAKNTVSRDEFRRYIDSLDLTQRYPGVQTMLFSRHVPAARKQAFEAAVRADTSVDPRGYPKFAIRPPGERAEYIVAEYVEPYTGNERALGLDLAGDPARRAALERTRDSGRITASGPIALVVSPLGGPGFTLRLATYRKDAPIDTIEQRRTAFLGVVSAAFVFNNMMHGVLREAVLQKLNVRVHDGGFLDDPAGPTPPSPETLLFESREGELAQGGLGATGTLIVGGRRWQLDFVARDALVASSDRWSHWIVLAVGYIISLLLFGLVRSLATTGSTALEMANRITADLRRSEAGLAEAQRMTQQLIEALPNPIYFKGTDGRYLGVNKAWETYFSTPREAFIGKTVHDLYPGNPEIARRLHAMDQTLWDNPGTQVHETSITTPDGQHHDAIYYKATFTRSDGSVAGMIANVVDITERKRAEERVRHLANYDDLTGLPNRSMFHQRLGHAIAQGRRGEKPLAVLFIDLDRFKNINDTLGHDAGDRVLKEIAERLRGCLRESDTVGRLGGDEFVVLLEDLPRPGHVAAVAQKIIAEAARPIALPAQEVHLTASIGIGTFPEDGADTESLMKNADIAMYRAKEQGKNTFQYYAAHLNVHSLARLELETALQHALERDEFLLHYQPKLDMASGQVCGIEALVRWQQPGKPLVPPAQFIPIAEETGLIEPIGEWVLKTACSRNRQWQNGGRLPPSVAVNLSARQFARKGLVQSVARILESTGLDPARLELEITESMVMRDPENAVVLLRSLKDMGIRLSMDDFGTGYSSLSYLKRFPIDSVKIDRSFIRDLPEDGEDAAITQAIIAMAHSLRLKVIAEGVETEAQLEFLRRHGCDEMQGYFFSKPLPEEELLRFLGSREAIRP